MTAHCAFQDWPKLESCIECGYDFTGLAPGRACPECGCGDGQFGTYLPVWSAKDAVDRGWRSAITASLFAIGLITSCALTGSWLSIGVFIAALILPVPIARLAAPASRAHDSRLVPTEQGVYICRSQSKPVFKAWLALRGVNLQSKRNLHDLFLLPRLDQPQPRFAERIVLDGSRARAEAIAALLAAQIQRAGEQKG